MRLVTYIDLIQAGGPGSGCNPDVGKCGRPPGATNQQPAPINWRRGRDSKGVQNRFSALVNGRMVVVSRDDSPTRIGKFRWKIEVDGKQVGKAFYKNAQGAREHLEKNKDRFAPLDPNRTPPQPDVSPVGKSKSAEPYRDDTPLARMAVQHNTELGGGINGSFKITLEDGTVGVWKPKAGESRELTRSIGGSLYNREALAYDVAKIVGAPVPETAIRVVDGKVGSIQRWTSGDVAGRSIKWNARNWANFDQDNLRSAAAFDFVTRNLDRHGGNFLIDQGSKGLKVNLIDHGLAFSRWGGSNKSIFDFVAHNDVAPISEGLKDAWRGKMPEIEKAMRNRGLGDKEVEMISTRLNSFMVNTRWADLGQHYYGLGRPAREGGIPVKQGRRRRRIRFF